MPHAVRIAIVGGGIGGLTAAIALRRRGFDCRVFERAPALAPSGTGVHLWTNALQALGEIGLAEAVGRIGIEITVSTFKAASGRQIFAIPVASYSKRLGAPTLGLIRPALHEVLTATLGMEAMTLGAECSAIAQDAQGVTVRFSNGTEERADLLIGADGLHSAVRRHLHGAKQPRFAGYTGLRAVCDCDHPALVRGQFEMFWGPGNRFVTYHVTGSRPYWLALAGAAEGVQIAPDQRKRFLLDSYRAFPEHVAALVESTPAASIVQSDIYDRPPIRRWGQGRITLLGDAAHPMTPNLAQGAGMAIEDGVVLARVLEAHRSEPLMALRRYEDLRRRRTAGFVRASRAAGIAATWGNPIACGLRNLMLGGASRAGLVDMTSDLTFPR